MLNELSLLDSLLGDAYTAPVFTYSPSVDVTENASSYTLEMDLPGYSLENVNVELDQDVLTISSKKEEAKKDKKEEKEQKKFLIRERSSANFCRRFTLPSDIDTESVTANFKDGVLTINIAKKEIAVPKKITIQAA